MNEHRMLGSVSRHSKSNPILVRNSLYLVQPILRALLQKCRVPRFGAVCLLFFLIGMFAIRASPLHGIPKYCRR
jgi:hypothetical protein